MANDKRYPLLEPWVFPNEDEGEVPRTVLACAIEPCTNPAEIEVSIAGYGQYPPMVFRLCPLCANAFGKLLHDWPFPPVGEMDIRAGSLASERSKGAWTRTVSWFEDGNEWQVTSDTWEPHKPSEPEQQEDTSERYPTRSPYVTTGVSREELEQSLASHKDAITLSPPPTLTTHVDDAIAYAYNSLRNTLEEDIRRIEAHPASNPPEQEQHKAGWLPGDD